jgi:hypothetical protein
MAKVCCICGQDFEIGGQTIRLTEDEKVEGLEAPEEVDYCASCFKVMSDREAGAQLLKGLYEMKLKELGVVNAKAMSDVYYQKLIERKNEG